VARKLAMTKEELEQRKIIKFDKVHTDDLKDHLDRIDQTIKKATYDGYYWSRLNILMGMWEKGQVILKFREVKFSSFYQLEKETGRSQISLKKWHDIYNETPDRKKYIKIAKKGAREWTDKAFAPKIKDSEDKISIIKIMEDDGIPIEEIGKVVNKNLSKLGDMTIVTVGTKPKFEPKKIKPEDVEESTQDPKTAIMVEELEKKESAESKITDEEQMAELCSVILGISGRCYTLKNSTIIQDHKDDKDFWFKLLSEIEKAGIKYPAMIIKKMGDRIMSLMETIKIIYETAGEILPEYDG